MAEFCGLYRGNDWGDHCSLGGGGGRVICVPLAVVADINIREDGPVLIIISNLRQKMIALIKGVVLLVFLSATGLGLAALYEAYAPDLSTWIEQESAKVGPMDMEPQEKTWFDQKMDQYVIKLQDLYYHERE